MHNRARVIHDDVKVLHRIEHAMQYIEARTPKCEEKD